MRSSARTARKLVYIGETGQTLKKRMTEHKLAMKRGDTNNSIAVHAWEAQHHVNWEGAQLKVSEPNTWKRKILAHPRPGGLQQSGWWAATQSHLATFPR